MSGVEHSSKNNLGIATLLASSIFGFSGCQERPVEGEKVELQPVASVAVSDGGGVERWRNYPATIHAVLSKGEAFCNDKSVLLDQAPYTVLIFASTNCPLAVRYVDKINELNKQFGESIGVKFVVAFPKESETTQTVRTFAREYDAHFNVMLDAGQKMADALHAERSPEVFLLDKELKLIYRGAIDDQLIVRGTLPKVRVDYLRDILEDLRTNQPIEYHLTDVEGCYLDRESFKDIYPTYDRDIGPLVEKHCTYCHRPGDVGSVLPLTDFGEIASSAHTLAERTDSRYMPPWRVDGRFGEFANDSRLDVNEMWAFRTWANQGVGEKEGSYKIDVATQNGNTRLLDPDAIVEMEQEFIVPKTGVLPYQHFTVKTNFQEGKWLIASEVRAMAPEVVHHINVFLVHENNELVMTSPFANRMAKMVAAKRFGVSPEEFDGVFKLYGPGMRRQLFLVGNYTPSHTALRFTSEHGVYIPPGAELVFECHYTPNGKETRDRSALALKFADAVPENPLGKQVITRSGAPSLNDIKIEPGGTKELTQTLNFHADARLVSLRPHMHLRGKDFQATIERPGQKPEIILSIPEWDYQWQIVYNFETPVALPAGTKLHMTYRWDNSDANALNPNPSQAVRFGTKINDEMGMAWPTYYYDNPNLTQQAEEMLEKGAPVQ